MHPAIPVAAHIHAAHRLAGTSAGIDPELRPGIIEHPASMLASAAIKSSAFIATP
jgi:hypothetical protein